jgi:hypothetical protein
MLKEFALSVSVLAAALPAFAQNNQAPPQSSNPMGQASPEVRAALQAMRQACAADIAKLCKDVEPGGGKIGMCLRDHATELSPGCTTAWQNVRAARKGGSQ